MEALMQIDRLEPARVLLNPMRVTILDLLREPSTCRALAERLATSPQRANNHLKELLRAGFIHVVEKRAKRNVSESVYQASARTYWLSPRLTRRLGEAGGALRDRMSLHNLIAMSERLQDDAAALLARVDEDEVPSLGATAEVTLRTQAEREAFARDYMQAMQALVAKYEKPGPVEARYTAMLVCYPAVGFSPDSAPTSHESGQEDAG